MGLGGISIWQLLIILAIVLLLFGTKRLRTLGTDLGNAIKGFRGALSDGEAEQTPAASANTAAKPEQKPEGRVIDGEVTHKERPRV